MADDDDGMIAFCSYFSKYISLSPRTTIDFHRLLGGRLWTEIGGRVMLFIQEILGQLENIGFQSLSQLKKIDFAIFERIQSIEIGSDSYLRN